VDGFKSRRARRGPLADMRRAKKNKKRKRKRERLSHRKKEAVPRVKQSKEKRFFPKV